MRSARGGAWTGAGSAARSSRSLCSAIQAAGGCRAAEQQWTHVAECREHLGQPRHGGPRPGQPTCPSRTRASGFASRSETQSENRPGGRALASGLWARRRVGTCIVVVMGGPSAGRGSAVEFPQGTPLAFGGTGVRAAGPFGLGQRLAQQPQGWEGSAGFVTGLAAGGSGGPRDRKGRWIGGPRVSDVHC